MQAKPFHQRVEQERDGIHVTGIFENRERGVKREHVRDPDAQRGFDSRVESPQRDLAGYIVT